MDIPYKLSRRTLLIGGAGAVVLAAAGPLTSQASEPDVFTLASWTPLLGRQLAAGTAVVRLETVEDLRRAPRPGEHVDPAERFRLGFSLVTGAFPLETITISHPKSGAVNLFITHSEGKATAVIDRRGASLLPPTAAAPSSKGPNS
ncbi:MULTISPECIES: hypothetical protein [Arthrobacter]|uniref:Uncharacterized protein n=1 Tax=Arthrobacter terricola TaxID=2547396 RepID=A0A4R5L0X5_9MICC|nr:MULTISPECIES: hypothetical protein [Arthrobacter]MBT8160016.1 hypothetical protein [Arthrobacter sp. GN70]TDG01021.1 hypothetical protein E1809_03050 [Arthrobacter terricola]